MSAHRATSGPGATVPPAPTVCADEPGSPVSGGAWDVRSWALLTAPATPVDGSDTGSRSGKSRETKRPSVRAKPGPADPVRELMHRHRGLCERAVDPLEIAAGLEAHGVTDRTAARFRHRDVFSLAEELFARVPRDEGRDPEATARQESGTAARPARGAWRRISRAVAATSLTLFPGMLTGLALALLVLTDALREGSPSTIVSGFVIAVAVAVGASVRLALHRVLNASPNLLTTLAAYWLTGWVIFGNQLTGGLSGAGSEAVAFGVTVPLSLACALAPAVWCARWFAVRARRRLAGSRSLDEFAAGMWPLLTAAVVLFAVALLGLQVLIGEITGVVSQHDGGGGPGLYAATALGVLLFTALLLTVHGFRKAASAGTGVACVMLPLALVLGPASAPGGPAAVACGCAAVGLLAYAYRVLTGASAHRRASRADCDRERCAHRASHVAGKERAICETCKTCENSGDAAL
ncbi:MAG TPA: hypothetical protein VGO89_02105 [Streptomyces sp.]|nr:hypothetical protein [Streptomyces sp.]